MLHALPLPRGLLPKLPKLPKRPISRPSRLVAVVVHRRCAGQCWPTSDAFFRTPGATSVWRVANPGSMGEIASPNVKGFACPSSSTTDGDCTQPPPMYRANVGVCLINDRNEVFVAQRLDIPGAWQMPQGGIDEDEDPRAAAFRELREETGVTSAKYLGEAPEWLTYDFPPEVKAKLTKLWGTEWNGQAQKWFLFRFIGNESEINLLGDGSESPEFSKWKWMPVEDVVNHAVEFKKQVYERAFKHLVKLMK